jgi:glycosyltransferase involved in cell wall biosynthesis
MNRPARILIVTSGHPCRNPRAVKEATTLADAGYTVTLLAPSHDPRFTQLDQELARGQRYALRSVPTSRALFRRIQKWLARRATRFGLQSVHALDFSPALFRAARESAADLTLVHNEIPHWIGLRLLDQGRRVAADIEDWHSEDLLPSDRRHRPLALLRSTERALLHRTAYTSTTSHALADALHKACGGKRPAVITNAFPLQPDPISRLLAARSSSFATAPSAPSFFWFSQTLGPGRGLESFLAAWSLTREPSRVVFLGKPSRDYDARLRSQIPETHRARLSFLPLVSPHELPAVIARHDIGLALEDPAIRNRDLTITNKILQYLNAGLAIVASDTAGQREVLARAPDAGFIASTADTPAFARQLDELLRDRAALRHRRTAARALAESHYCWECEAPRLIALVEGVLS